MGGNNNDIYLFKVVYEEEVINEPPSVSILSPTSGTKVSNDLTITGSSSDSDGTVEYVQIKIGSGTWIKVDGTIAWSYDFDTTELENGWHGFYTRAWDGED